MRILRLGSPVYPQFKALFVFDGTAYSEHAAGVIINSGVTFANIVIEGFEVTYMNKLNNDVYDANDEDVTTVN